MKDAVEDGPLRVCVGTGSVSFVRMIELSALPASEAGPAPAGHTTDEEDATSNASPSDADAEGGEHAGDCVPDVSGSDAGASGPGAGDGFRDPAAVPAAFQDDVDCLEIEL